MAKLTNEQRAALEKKLASMSPKDREQAEKDINEGRESIYIDDKEWERK